MAANTFLPNIGDVSGTRKELAWPDAVHIDALLAGYKLNGVVNGCVPIDGSGALDVDIAAGAVIIDGVLVGVSAQTVAPATGSGIGTARLDLITVNTSGTVVLTAGTVSSVPVYGKIPASQVVICGVLVVDGQTTIVEGDINDMRVDLSRQPMVVSKNVTTNTINDSSVEASLANYDIPARALGSDGGIRMRFGGQVLAATLTPVLSWGIDLGSTEIVPLTTILPFTVDADAMEYEAEIGFLNVTTATQRWWAKAQIGLPTSLSMQWAISNSNPYNLLVGYATSSVDMDAADRLLDLRHKWDDANTLISITREWQIVERIPSS